MKMRYLLIFILAWTGAIARSQNVDELKIRLNSAKSAEQKADALNDISSAYLRVNLDSCESYAKKALAISQEARYTSGEGQSLWMHGKLANYRGRFDTGLGFFRRARQRFQTAGDLQGTGRAMEEAGFCLMMLEKFQPAESVLDSALTFVQSIPDTTLMIHVMMHQSALYLYTGRMDESLARTQRAYDLAVAIDYVKYQINGLMNLGNFYSGRHQDDTALDYFLKAVHLIETRQGKPTQLHYCYNSIASIYIKKENPQKALEYGLKGLEISHQIHIKHGLMENYNVLAQAYLGLNAYEKSITWAEKALKIAREINIPTMIALCTANLGQSYAMSGRPRKALTYLNEAQAHFQQMENKHQLAQNLNILAKTHADLKEYRKAWQYQKQHDVLQDTLYSERNEKRLSELETEFQVKEKEAKLRLQASELSRQRSLNAAMALVAALFLIIAVLTWFTVRKSRRINRKLKALDAAKNRFFSNITHEMRNPLTLILAPLKSLVEKTAEGPYHAELKLAHANSRKLLDRVNEILDLSRLESGKMELNLEPVRLHDLCKRILMAYQSVAHYRKIGIHFKFSADPSLAVLMDIEKFEKILNNLILNAFMHSHTHGEVSLHIGQKNGTFTFSVKDTGEGIHPDDLPHIFTRYYQTAQENAPARGGSGIGLTLAREYARLLGGDIAVQSQLKAGSTFTVSLTLTETDKGLFAEEETPSIPHIVSTEDVEYTPLLMHGEKLRLLIVEDDLEMSRYLKEILSPLYDCHLTPDGAEALNALRKNRFDIILSDLMMPHMDGFEFRQRVRLDPRWARLPFVMLTARTMEEDRITGLSLGVDDYITKPFSPRELFARLHNLSANKRERDRYHQNNPDEKGPLSADEALLHKAEQFVNRNIDDSEFTTDKLAAHLSYSVRQLERLLKKAIGLSPNAFIREVRLQKAYRILEKRKFVTIKEVCYEVGMNNPAYFSARFKERFGSTPGEVMGSRNLSI